MSTCFISSASTPISPTHPPSTQSKRTRKWLIDHILRRFGLSSTQRRGRTSPVHDDTTAPPNSDHTSTALPTMTENQHAPSSAYDDDDNESIETLADNYPSNSDPHVEDLSLRRYLSPVDGLSVDVNVSTLRIWKLSVEDKSRVMKLFSVCGT